MHVHFAMRLTSCLCYLLLIAAFGTVTTASAGVLRGHIRDAGNGSTLGFATVVVRPDTPEGQRRGAAADAGGSYEITGLPAGMYTVRVTCIGYSPREVHGVTLDADSSRLDFDLVPASVDLAAITVSASRRPEKIIGAPAAVSVIRSEEIQNRPTTTVTEHVKGAPAVDVATTGINQSTMVVRGFNNIFSGALLVLTDNRMTHVPSLRYNAFNFIPVIDEDIDRIELVAGPGSALYGPNSAAGVMHVITRAPFGSEGTTVTIGGGERNLRYASFRHAGSVNHRLGYKVTGHYLRGDDWAHHEPSEPDSIRFFRPTPTGPQYESGWRDNGRDFDTEKLAAEVRADAVLGKDLLVIVNGGFNRANSIELTGLGAAQAVDWRYYFGQARLIWRKLYVQGFVNASDAGDTYLLPTGQLIVDRSRLWSGQVQHSWSPVAPLSIIYGADLLFTRPQTEGTINGRHEDSDNVDEIGVYVQPDYRLSSKIHILAALRYDHHSRLEDPVISPRAAVTIQVAENHNLRLTYNSAYGTPDNNTLFLDLLSAQDPFGLGAAFEPALGYAPAIDIRAEGVPESGFHWTFDENGPVFRSPFAPSDPRELSVFDPIEFNDPIFTNVMWSLGRGAVVSEFQSRALEAGLPQSVVDQITASMNDVVPSTVGGVDNRLMTFDPETRSFVPSDATDIEDIEPIRPTITRTVELGYKGSLNERFRFAADLYWTHKQDFVGPLIVETPNVFLDPNTLSGFLGPAIADAYAAAGPEDQAALAALDSEELGGNQNGTPVDELTAMFTSGSSQIPFGTVSPEEAADPGSILVTSRNFGDIDFYGADLSFAMHVSRKFDLGVTYSYMSANFWEKSSDQVHDLSANSPRHKAGLFARFSGAHPNLAAEIRTRWIDGFRMMSPFQGDRVPAHTVTDLNIAWRPAPSLRLALNVQNLFDERHIEFVGAPEIGRLATFAATQSF